MLNEKEKEIISLQEKIHNEQNEKMDLLEETTKVKLELNEIDSQNRNLKKELDMVNEKIKKNQFGVEGKYLVKKAKTFFTAQFIYDFFPLENVKAKIQQEKNILIHEHEQDLENYQKLLKDYAQLEQRNEHLENLVEKLTSKHSRSPSDASSLQSSHTSTEYENDVSG